VRLSSSTVTLPTGGAYDASVIHTVIARPLVKQRSHPRTTRTFLPSVMAADAALACALVPWGPRAI
jgi:hypothetical protein